MRMSKHNVILDATILSSLASCARYMDYRFNRNLIPKGGKSNSLSCGSLAHVILEFFHKSLIAGNDRNKAIDDGFKAGKEFINGPSPINLFMKSTEEEEYLQNTPEESDKRDIGWKYVLSTMEQYFDYYKNDTFTSIAAEEVKQKVIYEDDDLSIMWKSKFDRIVETPSGIMPVDVKTAKQRRDTMSMSNQFIGQTVLLRTNNIMIDKIGWQTSLPAHEKFTRVIIPYTSDRQAEWVNEIVPYYARMLVAYHQAEYFPPNFTSCESKFGFCEFYKHDVCNSDRGMREETLKIYFKEGKEWNPSND